MDFVAIRTRLTDLTQDNEQQAEEILKHTLERDAANDALVDMSAKHNALLLRVLEAFINLKMWSTTYVATQAQADALNAVQAALNEGVYEVTQ